MVITLSKENLEATLKETIHVLHRGGVIAYPTETFYGLGAKFDRITALQKIYAIKRRPEDKAMPLIVGGMDALTMLVEEIPDAAAVLIGKFWPGPLTIVFRARSGLSEYVTSDNKVAVRMPGPSFALELARAAGFPLTATSANISGEPPARSSERVLQYFDDIFDVVVDGGYSTGTLPSTIVDITGAEPTVLRQGAINARRILMNDRSL